jgi:hypothetical protein
MEDNVGFSGLRRICLGLRIPAFHAHRWLRKRQDFAIAV